MPVAHINSLPLPILFKSLPEPDYKLRICVIVPVRNEAETLWEILEALRLQTGENGQPLDHKIYEVLVLVNNCTDNSHAIAVRYQQQYPKFRFHINEIHLPEPQANIGTVRRMLMDEACSRLTKVNPDNGIIASTDGDTLVDSKWIYYIMEEMKGNDAVGGRILTQSETGITRHYHLRNVTYRCLLAHAEDLIDPQEHDPMPRHFQYFGASLAVTCAMYKQAGRLPQLPCLEDVAFGKALEQQDARIRKSFKVKVYTSFRLQGRVAVGFSEQLQKWTDEHYANIQQTVEPIEFSLFMFLNRSRLRRCRKDWQTGNCTQREFNAIARLLNLNSAELNQHFIAARHFGQLWQMAEEKLQAYRKDFAESQSITDAIAQLRAFISGKGAIAAPANPCDSWQHDAEKAA